MEDETMKEKTLDEIKPTWFRRIVMIYISPFMICLMVAMVFLMALVSIGCMVAEPHNAKSIAKSYWVDILGDFVGTIKYWHIDIWAGRTIRTGSQKYVDNRDSL